MRTLFIASGNSLRGDDGVAHRVLELLGASAEARSVMQLTPELAAEIAGFDTVIFLDAAVGIQTVTMEDVPKPRAAATLTHVSRPAEIVALSTALFGFRGRALECRIPAADFAAAQQLSPVAERFANEAARLLGERTI
jgi:Ni,Fe-hydrogenase maturation factor